MNSTATLKYILCAAIATASSLAQAQDKSSGQGLRKPAIATKPAAQSPKQAAAAQDNPGVKEVERIFSCVAAGLPEGWRRAWVVVTELSVGDKERTLEGKFQYSLDAAGSNPVNLVPCDARDVAQRVYALNDFLEPEKRQWKVATLTFTSDGKFEIKYDYVK